MFGYSQGNRLQFLLCPGLGFLLLSEHHFALRASRGQGWYSWVGRGVSAETKAREDGAESRAGKVKVASHHWEEIQGESENIIGGRDVGGRGYIQIGENKCAGLGSPAEELRGWH